MRIQCITIPLPGGVPEGRDAQHDKCPVGDDANIVPPRP